MFMGWLTGVVGGDERTPSCDFWLSSPASTKWGIGPAGLSNDTCMV